VRRVDHVEVVGPLELDELRAGVELRMDATLGHGDDVVRRAVNEQLRDAERREGGGRGGGEALGRGLAQEARDRAAAEPFLVRPLQVEHAGLGDRREGPPARIGPATPPRQAVASPRPRVTNIARLASPTARRMPEKPMPSAISTLDGSTMVRNDNATA